MAHISTFSDKIDSVTVKSKESFPFLFPTIHFTFIFILDNDVWKVNNVYDAQNLIITHILLNDSEYIMVIVKKGLKFPSQQNKNREYERKYDY